MKAWDFSYTFKIISIPTHRVFEETLISIYTPSEKTKIAYMLFMYEI